MSTPKENIIDVQYKFESDSEQNVFQQFSLPIDTSSPLKLFEQEQAYFKQAKSIEQNDKEMLSLYDGITQLYVLTIAQLKENPSYVYIMKNCKEHVDEIIGLIDEYLQRTEDVKIDDLKASIIPGGANSKKIDIKIVCFHLKNYIQVHQFANQFIIKEGIVKLITLMENTRGVTQAHACDAFASLLEYMNACQYVEENEELKYPFFNLLCNKTNKVKITENMLKVFIKIGAYFRNQNKPTKFYTFFYEAAERYSRENSVPIMQPMVNLINDSYQQFIFYSIALVTQFINYCKPQKAEERSQLINIVAELNYGGMEKILEKYKENAQVRDYYQKYKEAIKEIINSYEYQTQIYKNQIRKYEESYIEMSRKVEFVSNNQKYYDELVDDFLYFKKLSESCMQTAGLFEPNNIGERYDNRINRNIIIDENMRINLKKLLEKNPDDVVKLQKVVDMLKQQLNQMIDENKMLTERVNAFKIKRENMFEDDMDYEDADYLKENEILRTNIAVLVSYIKKEELNVDIKPMTEDEMLIQKRIHNKIGYAHRKGSFTKKPQETKDNVKPNESTKTTTPPQTQKPSSIPPVPGSQPSSIPPVPGSKPSSVPPVPAPPNSVPLPPPVPGVPPLPGSVPSIPKVPGAPSVPGVPGAPSFIPMKPLIQPTKKAIKLPTKVKTLAWNRIIMNPSISNSIWKNIKESNIKIEDVVSLFAIKQTPKPSTVEVKKPVNTTVSFLNGKRLQSVGITMAKLPSIEKVKQALETMDSSLVSDSQVEALNREYFKPEEIEEYKTFTDPKTKFGKQEEYLIALYNIKSSKDKLEIWDFVNRFGTEYKNVAEMLDANKAAVESLKTNKLIPIMFSYILSVGNVLNAGTNKGQADGFNIDILPKLSSIKDKYNHSVLQYICQKIKAEHPDFENIQKKFSSVKVAFGFPYTDMQRNWNLFKKGFPKIESLTEKLPSDKYKKKASSIISDIKKKIDDANKKMESIYKQYLELVKYLGISEKETYYTQPETLFKLFISFFDDVDNAIPLPQVKKKVFKPKFEMGAKVIATAKHSLY